MKFIKIIAITLIVCLVTLAVAQNNTFLIKVSSNWKYFDKGKELPQAWKTLNFDDSNWEDGKAQFGYGDEDETTIVDFGGDAETNFPLHTSAKLFQLKILLNFRSSM